MATVYKPKARKFRFSKFNMKPSLIDNWHHLQYVAEIGPDYLRYAVKTERKGDNGWKSKEKRSLFMVKCCVWKLTQSSDLILLFDHFFDDDLFSLFLSSKLSLSFIYPWIFFFNFNLSPIFGTSSLILSSVKSWSWPISISCSSKMRRKRY